jgi:hypothetical protein
MTITETYRYRAYDIVSMWQWSSWCTGIYPASRHVSRFRSLTLEDQRTLWGFAGNAGPLNGKTTLRL